MIILKLPTLEFPILPIFLKISCNFFDDECARPLLFIISLDATKITLFICSISYKFFVCISFQVKLSFDLIPFDEHEYIYWAFNDIEK